MTGLDDKAVRSDLEREALARVRHLVSGGATIDDVEEAKRWKQQSPEHADAFTFAGKLWDRLGPAGHNVLERRGERLLPGRAITRQPQLSRRAVLGGATALAASATAYVAIRPPFELWPSVSELAADYRTATGEQQRIALAEGASIELNTQTSISFGSSSETRDHIELISGEAAISTGQALKSPLTVAAGYGRFSAQNARFNVRYDGRASCSVSCLQGSLRVERFGSSLMLEAGRHVAYTPRGLSPSDVIDPDAIASWQGGLLVFRQTPLAEVVAEINRYRPGKILLLNAELGHRPVNARFRIENVDEIMTLAQRVFGAKVRSLPGGLVLLT
jgi:transmembrane sensor